jgi:hypothetical protein
MSHYASIKPRLLNLCANAEKLFERLSNHPDLFKKAVESVMQTDPTMTVKDAIQQMQHERVGFLETKAYVSQAQTIVFSTEQAQVFKAVTKDYTEGLDFRLPFPCVILQFTSPVPMPLMNYHISNEPTVDHLMAIILCQQEITEDYIKERDKARRMVESDPFNLLSMPKRFAEAKGGFTNRAVAIWSDWNQSRFGWLSESSDELANDDPENEIQAKVHETWAGVKRLAIACIGYINCENIYLHREGEVPEHVNAKRERKGKSRLEPYYVCRIRGVQYDGPTATGTGTQHGIRYDVRGHFRRLATGKTTWVRPHQRGLANELYVPKVYKVDKRTAA